MSYKKIVALSLFISLSLQQAQPISDSMVAICSVAGGVLVGGGTGIVLSENIHSESNAPAVLIGGSAGIATGVLIYCILSKHTPNAYFNYASNIISSLNMNFLINTDINDAEKSTARITARFGSSWSLVLAREKLMEHTQSLCLALASLDIAYTENCQEKDKSGMIIQGYPGLLATASVVHDRIERVLTFISNHPRYEQQVAFYEHYREKKARTLSMSIQAS